MGSPFSGKPIAPMSTERIEKFWSRVQKTEGCWNWTGTDSGLGYGVFVVAPRQQRLAHRISYELLVGPIPTGLTLDHLCRNRACVRPEHLEAVTAGENVLRGTAPSALFARAVSCAAGHPFDEGNTRVTRAGVRQCRACDRDRYRKAHPAAKGEAA